METTQTYAYVDSGHDKPVPVFSAGTHPLDRYIVTAYANNSDIKLGLDETKMDMRDFGGRALSFEIEPGTKLYAQVNVGHLFVIITRHWAASLVEALTIGAGAGDAARDLAVARFAANRCK